MITMGRQLSISFTLEMAWKGLFTVLALFFLTYVIADEYGYDEDDHWHEDDHYGDDHYEDDHYEDEYSAYGPSQQGSRYGSGYGGYGGGYGGRGYGRGGRGYSGFDGPQRGVRYGPGYSGLRKNGPGYGYKGSSQFYKDGVFGGKGPHIAGGRFGLGRGGIKSALAPITNAALHGNFNPLGNYGYGGYGGLENYAGKEINRYRLNKGLHALNPDDLDGDGGGRSPDPHQAQDRRLPRKAVVDGQAQADRLRGLREHAPGVPIPRPVPRIPQPHRWYTARKGVWSAGQVQEEPCSREDAQQGQQKLRQQLRKQPVRRR